MAEKLAPNVTPETFLEFYRQAGIAKRDLERAQGEYRAVLKRAKKAGIDTKALIAVRAIATSDDPAAEEAHLNTLLRYARYLDLPLGTQLGLFDDAAPSAAARTEQAEWDAEDYGYRAGRGGQNRDDNPHAAGTAAHVRWDEGWHKGQASIAQDMADGKPPRAKARRGRAGNPEDRPVAH